MFRNKLFVFITAVMLFMVPQLYADDKIFTSSGQILPGEEWSNVYIYNDDTIVDMLGGRVDSMAAYDASTLNINGGDVSTLHARGFSTANVSGGYVYGLRAQGSGTVNLSDTASVISLSSRGSFGTVNMTGGSTEYARAGNSGTLNLYGGVVTDSLNAWDSATVNIFGYDLFKTATGGTYGYGFVTGYWVDGTPFTIDLSTSETYSHISLITIIDAEIEIHPETLNLASKNKWITCHIWLPEGYDVTHVEPETILIDRRFKADWSWYNEKQQVVMAKFKRSQLSSILETGEIELIVSCHLIDGTYFEGTDTVKVTNKGRGRR